MIDPQELLNEAAHKVAEKQEIEGEEIKVLARRICRFVQEKTNSRPDKSLAVLAVATFAVLKNNAKPGMFEVGLGKFQSIVMSYYEQTK